MGLTELKAGEERKVRIFLITFASLFLVSIIVMGIVIPFVFQGEEKDDSGYHPFDYENNWTLNIAMYADDDTLVIEVLRGNQYWYEKHIYAGDHEFYTSDNTSESGDIVVFHPEIDFDIIPGIEYYVSIHNDHNMKKVLDYYVTAIPGQGSQLARDLPG